MPSNSPVYLLRGIDRVGLPSCVGVFFGGKEPGLEEEGEGVVVKNLGWRKDLGWKREGTSKREKKTSPCRAFKRYHALRVAGRRPGRSGSISCSLRQGLNAK